jgi:hypothetical protein
MKVVAMKGEKGPKRLKTRSLLPPAPVIACDALPGLTAGSKTNVR